MRERKRAMKLGLAILTVVTVAVVLGALVSAASTRSSSGQRWATFVYCEILCLPVGYYGEGTVTATYQNSGTSMRITRIEQTMSLYNARNNPCRLGVGITTQVFADRGASLVATVQVQTKGTYWLAPSTEFYGGYSNVNLTVRNPRLRGRGFAAPGGGSTCLGWKSFDWDFNL